MTLSEVKDLLESPEKGLEQIFPSRVTSRNSNLLWSICHSKRCQQLDGQHGQPEICVYV